MSLAGHNLFCMCIYNETCVNCLRDIRKFADLQSIHEHPFYQLQSVAVLEYIILLIELVNTL